MSEKDFNKVFSKRIRYFLEKNEMTQVDLAKRLGVSATSVSDWCNGKKSPRMSKIDAMCDIFHCRRSDLTDDLSSNPPSVYGRYLIPVLTTVAAGKPIYAEEDVIEWIDYDKDPGNHIRACRIDGSSMIPRIQSGDTVIFDTELDWENGDVVIATINGDHATCKRIKRYADGIALLSDNASIAPMYFSRQEVEELPVTIVGRVIEVRGKL